MIKSILSWLQIQYPIWHLQYDKYILGLLYYTKNIYYGIYSKLKYSCGSDFPKIALYIWINSICTTIYNLMNFKVVRAGGAGRFGKNVYIYFIINELSSKKHTFRRPKKMAKTMVINCNCWYLGYKARDCCFCCGMVRTELRLSIFSDN